LNFLPPGFGSVAFSMPLGLIDGRPFKPFSRAMLGHVAPLGWEHIALTGALGLQIQED
jgi:hypothetical protein